MMKELRLEQASAVGFALTRNCNLSGPGFRPCMQRFVRIGSKATGRSVQFMAYAPMQPGTFLLDLKNATR